MSLLWCVSLVSLPVFNLSRSIRFILSRINIIHWILVTLKSEMEKKNRNFDYKSEQLIDWIFIVLVFPFYPSLPQPAGEFYFIFDRLPFFFLTNRLVPFFSSFIVCRSTPMYCFSRDDDNNNNQAFFFYPNLTLICWVIILLFLALSWMKDGRL
jgi:hypothetical protein